jgi:regulator of nonsense transcripts 3
MERWTGFFTNQGKTPLSKLLLTSMCDMLNNTHSPSKPSRPSRAYFHMTCEPALLDLSETIRRATFEDALNTFMSPSLVGPPTVEFAPYGRTPGGRRRIDARSGTIDQDPEFMAFLEGLANPTTTKDPNTDLVDGIPAKTAKVTTTPLVQFLKDKKASKNKESAAKAAKKHELQLAKGKSIKESISLTSDPKKKGRELKTDKVVEKAAKDTVKILNREAASKTASATPSGEGSARPKLDLSKVPPRQRGTAVAAHIRMLQRDLGLSPAQAHRQVGRDTADARRAERAAAAERAASEHKIDGSDSAQASSLPTASKSSSIQPTNRRVRGRGPELETNKASSIGTGSAPSTASPRTPMALLKKPETPKTTPTTPSISVAKPPIASSSRKPQIVAVPSDGITQAFVKHANPSQGVTEALLKEAMEVFGAVSLVEIDKRKGFAYVDFVNSDGLKKAIAANPIPVAQGTVQVMQRKGAAAPPEKKVPHQAPHAPSAHRGARGGRGGTVGRRGGRGGHGGQGGGARAGGSSQGENSKSPISAPAGPAAK